MTKRINNFITCVIVAILSTMALSSCNSGDDQIRYIAAKLVDSNMWSIVDLKTGEVLYQDEFKNAPSVIAADRFCVQNEEGLYDYYSIKDVKKPINSESYLYATSFTNSGVALAVQKGKPISVIDKNCKVVKEIDSSITNAEDFSNGFAVVNNEDNKKGYINEKGDIVIQPAYDSAYAFSKDEVAIVTKEVNDTTRKFYAIDKKGKELFTFSASDYRYFGSYVNGYLPVQKESGEVFLLNKKGEKEISLGTWKGQIPDGLTFNNDVIVFQDGDSYGLKNKKGEIVLRAKYDDLIPIPDVNKNYYLSSKDGKFGIIDKDDNIIVPFDYSGLAALTKNVLVQGDYKSFSLMDLKCKDFGQNNYIDFSINTGSEIISNFFDVDKQVAKLMSNITASSFFKTKKGQVLSDFKHLLTEKPSNSNTNSNLLSESENSYDLLYAFDKKIATPTYEYYYGFSFPNGATYNYDAKLLACQTDIHLSQYQPDTEEALTKALEKKLQTIGFAKSPNNNYYMTNSKTGTSVGIGYENGHVTIIYAYDTAHTIKLVRTPRNDEIRANTMNLGLGIIENDSVIEYEDEDDLADYD